MRFATRLLLVAYVLIAVSWIYLLFGRFVIPRVIHESLALGAAFAFIFVHQGAAVLFGISAIASGSSLYREPGTRTAAGLTVFLIALISAAALGGILVYGFIAEEVRAYHRARPNQAMERTATRRAFPFCVINTSSLRSALALGGRRSSYSR